jgi:hypothetical protein
VKTKNERVKLMSDNSALLIKALEAAGHDQAAALARAILPVEAAAPAEAAPAEGAPREVALQPQVGVTLPAGAVTGSPAPAGHAAALTWAEVQQMTPEQINARWDEVSAVMEAQGRS